MAHPQRGRQELPPSRLCRATSLKEGGKNSHRHGFAATPPSKREARYNHSRKEGSHASRPCVRASFLPTMAKNSFRGARTPHRGGAHNAALNPAPAHHICAYLRLRGKSELTRVKLKALKIASKEKTSRSQAKRVAAAFSLQSRNIVVPLDDNIRELTVSSAAQARRRGLCCPPDRN